MRLWLAAFAALSCAAQQEATVAVGQTTVKYLYSTREKPGPLLVVLPGPAIPAAQLKSLFAQYDALAAPRNWRTVMPAVYTLSDGGVLAIERVIADARKRTQAVEWGAFLIGAGQATSEVFYAASRAPDLFSAAVAAGGVPQAAMQSGRLYAANLKHVPLLWVDPPKLADRLRQKLQAWALPYEPADGWKDAQIVDWLHSKGGASVDPEEIDCETHSPQFGRCYWIEMTKFDLAKRNDALRSTRVPPGSGAGLSFGGAPGFGYDPAGAGPGVRVTWLPPDYKGPLEVDDRIVEIGYRDIGSGADYAQFMDEVTEEKSTSVTVDRKGKQVKLSAKITLPKRDVPVTARVKAQRIGGAEEVTLTTRGVSEIKVTLPERWTAAVVNWNGTELKTTGGGCWIASAAKEPPSIAKCAVSVPESRPN